MGGKVKRGRPRWRGSEKSVQMGGKRSGERGGESSGERCGEGTCGESGGKRKKEGLQSRQLGAQSARREFAERKAVEKLG